MKRSTKIIRNGILFSAGMLFCLFLLIWKSSPVEGLAWNPPAFRHIRNGGDDLSAACPAISGLSGQVTGISPIGSSFLVSTRSPNALWMVSSDHSVELVTKLASTPTTIAAIDRDFVIVGLEERGIFRFSISTKSLRILNSRDREAVLHPSAIAVAEDGTFAVAEGSQRFDSGWPLDFLDGRPNGRIFVGHRTSESLIRIPGNFYFTSGLSFDQYGRSLLIAETFRYRVRHMVRQADGEYKEISPWVSNLPIMPYAIERAGNSWYLSGSLRNNSLDTIQKSSVLRRLAALMPYDLLKSLPTRQSTRHAIITKIEPHGLRMAYQNFGGSIYGLSTFKLTSDSLLFGSFYQPGLRVAKLNPDRHIHPCTGS